jgi:hypothetical protein
MSVLSVKDMNVQGLQNVAPATSFLIIATPHNGNVSPECASSRELLLHNISGNRQCIPIYLRNCNISRARNNILYQASILGADVIFIDSDMEFLPEDFLALVNSGKDVVSALCFKRAEPYTPCAFNFDINRYQKAITEIPDNIFKVDSCGMAFCLIKHHIIKLMTSSDVVNLIGKPFNHIQNNNGDDMEEDISFCIRLKILNIPVWIIPHTNVLHAGIGWKKYKKYKEETVI